MPATGHVLCETHDKCVFVGNRDDQSRDSCLPQLLKCLETTLATNKGVAFCAILPWTGGNGYWLFQTNGPDVFHDGIEFALVSFTRIQNIDPVHRNHAQLG